MAQKSGENLQLPTADELSELSHYAQVAYATRCALRVFTLTRESAETVQIYNNAIQFCALYTIGLYTEDDSDLEKHFRLIKNFVNRTTESNENFAIHASQALRATINHAYDLVTNKSITAGSRILFITQTILKSLTDAKLNLNNEVVLEFQSDFNELRERYSQFNRPINKDFYHRPLWSQLNTSELERIEKIVEDWIYTIQSRSKPLINLLYWHFFDSRRHGEIPWDSIESEVRQWLAELESENTGDNEDISIPDQESSELGREFSTAGKMFDTHNLNGAAVSLGGDMSNEDLLGREKLVNAMADMIASPGQDTPFTIGLLGDWGSGKSNVMHLLRKTLEERADSERFYFADFNAWEYEHTDNMAAGVAQEVLKGLLEKKNFWQQLWIRIRFGKEENGLIMPVLGVTLLLVAIGTFVMAITQQTGGWIAAFIATGGTLTLFFKQILTIIEHPLTAEINSYLKLPKYADYLGTIPVLKRHLKTLCALVISPGIKKPNRLIVFVDDLDRCDPEAISRTLDAIRLVMDIENVVIIIGIDHRIAFRAVEKQYVALADDERTSADIARDYLGKIIQLPVMLNNPGEEELERFISEKLFSDVKEREITDRSDQSPIPDNKEINELAGMGERDKSKTAAPAGEETGKDDGSVDVGNESVLNQIKRPIIKGQNPDKPQSQTDESDIMTDTYEEKKYFTEMCTLFGLHNPRQLIRLRNCYRLLKRIVRPNEEEWRPQMILLFWLEFLYAQQQQDRIDIEECFYDKDPGKLDNILQRKGFDKNLSETIAFKLNLQKDDFSFYERIVNEVKRLVLPHSESAKRAKEESEAPVVDGSPDQKKSPEDKP